ncbi:response regulator [Desulfosarcina sp.]|uniref:response regulator n=1 Tax=Desulfosarcina sp. TaxID=2027861 RepID=UPI003970EF6E
MKHFDILIVDDEQRYAQMLANRFKLRGLSCEVRYDGRTALESVENSFFKWVILDLRLPDCYGSEVLTRIKKISPTSEIIILTGHGTEADQTRCLALGAYAFMNKPLDIEQMIAIMSQNRAKSI